MLSHITLTDCKWIGNENSSPSSFRFPFILQPMVGQIAKAALLGNRRLNGQTISHSPSNPRLSHKAVGQQWCHGESDGNQNKQSSVSGINYNWWYNFQFDILDYPWVNVEVSYPNHQWMPKVMNYTIAVGEGTRPLRVAIIVKCAWNIQISPIAQKNPFVEQLNYEYSKHIRRKYSKILWCKSLTKSKQMAKNAPFLSPIGCKWSNLNAIGP